MLEKEGVVWFGRYEGWLKMIAKGVASGDDWAISKAAMVFDIMLPDDALVVPMPSHHGEPVQMLEVAWRLQSVRRARREKCVVMDRLLRQVAGSGARWQKEQGYYPDVKMYLAEGYAVKGANVCVIDNVVCTGATAQAALSAMQGCAGAKSVTVCAVAYSPWRRF